MSYRSDLDKIPLSIEVRLGVFFIILFLLISTISPQKNILIETENVEIPQSSKEISHGDNSKMNVIFTFDGGSIDISSNKILEILAKYNIKTSFFLTGDFVINNPKIVINMQKGGHEIYNHTKNHLYLTKIDDFDILLELQEMDKDLKRITGKSSKPYFRPPYGDRDERVLKIAYGAGYQSVYWTVDALDWRENEGISMNDVKNIVLDSLAPGNIYLFHLGDYISGNILEELIIEINKRGYNIVSLKQGL